MRASWFVVAVALCGSCKKKGGSGHDDYAALEVRADQAEKAGKDGKDGKKSETWKRSQVVPNSSRVMVGDSEQLALRSMQTRVMIDGYRARVVIDYLYDNDNDRSLEGTFQLRLPEEASPYFFAFGETGYERKSPAKQMVVAALGGFEPRQIMKDREQSWKAPREARMVPREKAQIAYGQTVQRRVDPAIVEWAGAGVFTARVFPLAPHQLHRIVVGYDVDLTKIDGDLEYKLDLPEKVPVSAVDISVAGVQTASVTPAVASSSAIPGRLLYHFDARQDQTIAVRIPKPGAPLLVGADGDNAYFATRVVPQLRADSSSTRDTAVFAVDTSLSSNPDRFNIWLALMRAVLDKNRDSLKRFNVVFFSVDAHWYKPAYLDNTPENVDALIAFASSLALEGATDLGAALGEAAHPAWQQGASDRHDIFLLSDGAATWGEANLHALGKILDGTGSLFAYQTGLAGTDVGTLVHLARDSGGAVFSVTGEAEVARAAVAHRARPWRLVGVDVTGGTDVLVAGNPTTLFPGQTVQVVGRGAIGANAELTLTLEQDGKREVVKTKLGAPIESMLAPRSYGQIATAHLEELELATEPQARAYATHFRVTGKTCSLLMLETERDGERFGIKPDDDAFVVKSTPAGELFAKALRDTIATLGDPKVGFVAMIAKLERNPDIRLDVPASFRTVVDRMPAAAFAVPQDVLATKQRLREQLRPEIAKQLAAHDLDYEAVTLDAAARKQQSPADALKALSSLVEQNPGDAVLARDVGYSAMELGLRAQAYHLFHRVAEARPHEPQTYRAIAQALAALGNYDLALAYYEIPLMGRWDPRFGELRKIVELDYLRFLRRLDTTTASATVKDYAHARVETLARDVGIVAADVVVSITWNTDNTDVDLHVTEPGGEECFFSHRRTKSGGQLTQDVTQGYGPEMYVLPHAPKGEYEIRAHYYASDRNRTSARTKVYVSIIQDWGTPQERATEQVVTLESGKDYHSIATLQR
ncbi:MAG: DUF2135 domain-containing protein [Kofleriaceae bacterium]